MNKILEIIGNFINWLLGIILQKTLTEIISASRVGRFAEKRRRMIEAINPESFHAKQLAPIIGIPASFASLLSDLAVRQGRFILRVPGNGEAKSYGLMHKGAK